MHLEKEKAFRVSASEFLLRRKTMYNLTCCYTVLLAANVCL